MNLPDGLLGVVTARDEWVYAESDEELMSKVKYLINTYNSDVERLSSLRDPRKIASAVDYSIKCTRAVKRDLKNNKTYAFDPHFVIDATYRPFFKVKLYFSPQLNEMNYQQRVIFGWRLINTAIVIDVSGKPFSALAVHHLPDYHVNGDGICFPLSRYISNGNRLDNITDRALEQFHAHYESAANPSPLPGEGVPAPAGTDEGVEGKPNHPALRATLSRKGKRDNLRHLLL